MALGSLARAGRRRAVRGDRGGRRLARRHDRAWPTRAGATLVRHRRRARARTPRATPASPRAGALIVASSTTTCGRRPGGWRAGRGRARATPRPTPSAARSARAWRARPRAAAAASPRRSRRSTWAPRTGGRVGLERELGRPPLGASSASAASTRPCAVTATRRSGCCACARPAAASSTWPAPGSTTAARATTRACARWRAPILPRPRRAAHDAARADAPGAGRELRNLAGAGWHTVRRALPAGADHGRALRRPPGRGAAAAGDRLPDPRPTLPLGRPGQLVGLAADAPAPRPADLVLAPARAAGAHRPAARPAGRRAQRRARCSCCRSTGPARGCRGAWSACARAPRRARSRSARLAGGRSRAGASTALTGLAGGKFENLNRLLEAAGGELRLDDGGRRRRGPATPLPRSLRGPLRGARRWTSPSPPRPRAATPRGRSRAAGRASLRITPSSWRSGRSPRSRGAPPPSCCRSPASLRLGAGQPLGRGRARARLDPRRDRRPAGAPRVAADRGRRTPTREAIAEAREFLAGPALRARAARPSRRCQRIGRIPR